MVEGARERPQIPVWKEKLFRRIEEAIEGIKQGAILLGRKYVQKCLTVLSNEIGGESRNVLLARALEFESTTRQRIWSNGLVTGLQAGTNTPGFEQPRMR